MTKSLGKRGMSPIIATILLIAFAVSIGATITTLGGFYHEKVSSGDSDCYKVLINVFDIENKEQCKDYGFKSIVKFYYINETPTTPQCYREVATGTADICRSSDILLDLDWVPAESIVE